MEVSLIYSTDIYEALAVCQTLSGCWGYSGGENTRNPTLREFTLQFGGLATGKMLSKPYQ